MKAKLAYAAVKLERPYVGRIGQVTRTSNPRLYSITFDDGTSFVAYEDQLQFVTK